MTRPAARVLAFATSLAWAAMTVSPDSAAAVEVEVKGGLAVSSDDGAHRFGVGGRIQQDWAFIGETSDFPDSLGAPDGTEFRRARLHVEGRLYRVVFFKSQWDFAGGKVIPKDVFMGVSGVPGVQNLRFGKQYEPFNLNELTSSNHLVFIERSPIVGFAPSRRPGIQAYGGFGDGAGTWGAGVFRDDGTAGDVGTSTGDGEYAETARVTFLPYRAEDGRTLVHLGAAASHRVPPGHMRSYAFRPSVHLAKSLVATGSFAVDRVVLLGGEAAVVAGPFSVQGEVMSASHEGPSSDAPDPTFFGGYALASVFLTGEHRAYSTASGTFGRIKPRRNLGDGEGAAGAVELAARVTRVDLDDASAGIEGGVLTDVAVGGNWYLNPNAKLAVNVVRATVDGVDGAVYAGVVRFHVDF